MAKGKRLESALWKPRYAFGCIPQKKIQGLNVCVKTGEEVISKARFLLIVKMKSLNQVVTRRVKDSHSHRMA
jgi:hypothetical protein